MHKASEILGLPVVSVKSGKVVGHVHDLCCDTEGKLLGVVLREKSWFQSGKYIPAAHIFAFGEDAIIVEGKETIASLASLHTDTVGLVSGRHRLKGKPVFTQTGRLVGTVEDVYFSSNWEKLVGYELSDGWVSDVLYGRKRLSNTPPPHLSDHALFVSDTTTPIQS